MWGAWPYGDAMGVMAYFFFAAGVGATTSGIRVFSVLSTWVTRPSWTMICTEPKRMASIFWRTMSIHGSTYTAPNERERTSQPLSASPSGALTVYRSRPDPYNYDFSKDQCWTLATSGCWKEPTW